MGESKIEWTDATWNPLRGCSVVSPGCRNCYAMKQAHRFSGAGGAYEDLTKQTKAGPQWTGTVRLADDHLLDPLKWRTPRRVFVNSMSDLFHESVPDDWIERIFAVMTMAPQHTFQVLTKRARRMRRWCETNSTGGRIFHVAQQIDPKRHGARSGSWPLPNVWLGVSVENQKYADERIPHLLKTPAAVRFISAEPLLGPVDLSCGYWLDCEPGLNFPTPDWVIIGGESGNGARPFDIAWARSIVNQCKNAGVACFVKQLGARPTDGWNPEAITVNIERKTSTTGAPASLVLRDRKGGDITEWPADLRVRQFPGVTVP